VCDCATPGDFDEDGVVTLTDVADFMNCYTGSVGGPIATACADFNGDGVVDAKDTRDLVERLASP